MASDTEVVIQDQARRPGCSSFPELFWQFIPEWAKPCSEDLRPYRGVSFNLNQYLSVREKDGQVLLGLRLSETSSKYSDCYEKEFNKWRKRGAALLKEIKSHPKSIAIQKTVTAKAKQKIEDYTKQIK